MQLERVSFSDILPVWKEQLWLHQKAPIQAMSSMLMGGGHDLGIYQNHLPSFWGFIRQDKLVAVVSGHGCGSEYYRSRGLWVNPNYRRKKLGSELMQAVFTQAALEGYEKVWTFARYSSFGFYSKLGFVQCSDWIESPLGRLNCYADKFLVQ